METSSPQPSDSTGQSGGEGQNSPILVAYFSWADNAVLAEDVDAVASPSVIPPGNVQQQCGVADLKMSDYGIRPDECMTLARNARATMGGLFACDRVPLSDEECAAIFEKSYR